MPCGCTRRRCRSRWRRAPWRSASRCPCRRREGRRDAGLRARGRRPGTAGTASSLLRRACCADDRRRSAAGADAGKRGSCAAGTPPPGGPPMGLGSLRSPGLTPSTETSARSPPLVAGSMVTLAVIVPDGRLFPVLAMGLRLNAVVDQRRDVSVPLQDGHLDDAVVERPTVAVVGEGDGIVDRDFGDLRQYVGGRLLRRCAGEQESCQREKHRYKRGALLSSFRNLSEQIGVEDGPMVIGT